MDIYFTMPRSLAPRQISILDIIDGKYNENNIPKKHDKSYTVTRKVTSLNHKMMHNEMSSAIYELKSILMAHNRLFDVDLHTLYRKFCIPKNSGGWRTIQAPYPKLRAFHSEFVEFINTYLTQDRYGCKYALHHTSAYAYIKKRCVKDALIRHQFNESKWYAKTDFSDFFGSTTQEFVEQQLSMIYPISTMMANEEGRDLMHKALSLCFLDGGLPQGTTVSPMLTNLMMIPIDHRLTNLFHQPDEHGHRFVYTRYADDIQLSSKCHFSLDEKVGVINNVLKEFNAPFAIKREKLRYGSVAGRNWNLGLMINKDNEITIGSKNINLIKVMTHNFILDHMNGKAWDRAKVMRYQGKLEYAHFIQPERIDGIIAKYSEKFGIDLIPYIKLVLKEAV